MDSGRKEKGGKHRGACVFAVLRTVSPIFLSTDDAISAAFSKPREMRMGWMLNKQKNSTHTKHRESAQTDIAKIGTSER